VLYVDYQGLSGRTGVGLKKSGSYYVAQVINNISFIFLKVVFYQLHYERGNASCIVELTSLV
jgi:hypothetical protein